MTYLYNVVNIDIRLTKFYITLMLVCKIYLFFSGFNVMLTMHLTTRSKSYAMEDLVLCKTLCVD
jgi:hypothetical protein